MSTYSFGDNTINDDQQLIEIQLRYGGLWKLDIAEIVQLAEILAMLQQNVSFTDAKIWRMNGQSAINVKNTLGCIFFDEDDNQGHFLSSEVADLVESIKNIVSPIVDYPFDDNFIRLYKRSNGLRLYVIVLQANLTGKGIWVFNDSEIQQLQTIVASFPNKGEITRSSKSQVFVKYSLLTYLKEGNHKNRFFGGELSTAIRQLQDL